MEPDPMTFSAFMSQMLKPTYVWRMASGITGARQAASREDRPLTRSARTRMRNAQRTIDDLVLRRAAVIADERRCAAVQEIGTAAPKRAGDPEEVLTVRCEYARGHGTVGPGVEDPKAAHVTPSWDWDHGAPSAKTWWKEGEPDG